MVGVVVPDNDIWNCDIVTFSKFKFQEVKNLKTEKCTFSQQWNMLRWKFEYFLKLQLKLDIFEERKH